MPDNYLKWFMLVFRRLPLKSSIVALLSLEQKRKVSLENFLSLTPTEKYYVDLKYILRYNTVICSCYVPLEITIKPCLKKKKNTCQLTCHSLCFSGQKKAFVSLIRFFIVHCCTKNLRIYEFVSFHLIKKG